MRARNGLAASIFLSCCAPVPAQNSLLWVEQFGTSEQEEAWAVVSDGSGGAYVAGHTLGSLQGESAGDWDAYLARYDSAGNQLWIRQFGTSAEDTAWALSLDTPQTVYVAGRTLGDLGGVSEGSADIFIAKYTSEGDRVWIKQFGTEQYDEASALTPDGMGGVFFAGATDGNLAGVNAGMPDVFVGCMDSEGDQVWLSQFGTEAGEFATGLAADDSSGVFVGGATTGSLGGPNQGDFDVFLSRYDGNGNPIWSQQLGTPEYDVAWDVATDEKGGAFIAGTTEGDLLGKNAGVSDIFFAHYEQDGHRDRTGRVGTPYEDRGYGVVSDGSGGVYLTGLTAGSFCGQKGIWDAYVFRWPAFDQLQVIAQFGTAAQDAAFAITRADEGGVFIAGTTGGDLGGPNQGQNDAFIARAGDGTCYGNCNGDCWLDLFDFLCYTNEFNMHADSADCDGDGALTLFDFLCFVNSFNTGCH